MEFITQPNYLGMSILDLTAMTAVLLQVWLYGRLSLMGPVMGVIGCCLWIAIGMLTSPVMIGLIILNLILMTLNVVNYFKWVRNRKLAAAAAEQGDAPEAVNA